MKIRKIFFIGWCVFLILNICLTNFVIADEPPPEGPGSGSGWDMVSLPINLTKNKYDVNLTNGSTTITWQKAVDDNIIIDFLYGWDFGIQNYEIVTDFVPYHGYWMYFYDHNYTLDVDTNESSVNVTVNSTIGKSSIVNPVSISIGVLLMSPLIFVIRKRKTKNG